jgi:hypothetical protein
MSTDTIYYKGPGSFTGVLVGTVLFGVGPLLSMLAVMFLAGSSLLPIGALSPTMLAVLVLWSPFVPLSIPALLTQDARDKMLPQYHGLVGNTVRATLLIPHILRDPRSSIRVETLASLVGFFLALVVFVAR